MSEPVQNSELPKQPWHKREIDAVLAELDTQREGLEQHSAEQRLQQFGPNKIGKRRQISAWAVLLHQFTSPLIYVLLGALVATIAISLFTGESRWADAIVIGAVLVVNATIGFFQEYRAEHSVEELMKMVAPQATVRRAGETQEIDADQLVPGDIVTIGEGRVVPADLRLIEVNSLQVDEAALTGESVPVNKTHTPMRDAEDDLTPAEQENMAFTGTAVTSGSAEGVVVATGKDTQIGRIAAQVEAAGETRTPLERRIQQLAIWITWGILAIAAVAILAGVAAGRDWTQMVLVAVALAVAAIPAGLPIVVTVALAIGVRRMARQHAVIRKLPAVDTLGSCTTIVSDKTGTLTQNKMNVRAIFAGGRRFEVTGTTHSREGRLERDGEAVDPERQHALYEALLVGTLCNDAQIPQTEAGGAKGPQEKDEQEPEHSGDPMEVALLYAGLKGGLSRETLSEQYPRIDEVPFQTERRFMATIHEQRDNGGEQLVAVKGAPEAVVALCRNCRTEDGEAELDADAVREQADIMAGEGLRVLAMAVGFGAEVVEAVKSDQPAAKLTFVGLQGMLDPPRPAAVEAVDNCHAAGIRAIMVTGDHARTAAAIAHEVHLDLPAEAKRRERGHGATAGEAEAEVRVAVDADNLTAEAKRALREHLTVDARLPKERDLRVVVDIAGKRRASSQQQSQENELPEALSGRDLKDLSEEELRRVMRSINVYARVEPTQKTDLVNYLKDAGEIVAVTGDGVNDAPALKAAHIGAAMGSGTDVAKESSDMVITDDNFASVFGAVKEGRTAFRNIRMATFFLLSTGAAMVLVILSALVLGWPLPLLAAQILWCNVVTNGIADVALAFEPGEKALYERPPRPPQEGVLDRLLLERLALVGVWLAVGTLGMFLWKWGFDFRTWAAGDDENLTLARTAALTTMVLFQKVHVFNCRSEDVSIFGKSLLANKVLLLGVLASLAIHAAAVYIPLTQELLGLTALDAMTWVWAALIASTAIIINELHKRLRPRYA